MKTKITVITVAVLALFSMTGCVGNHGFASQCKLFDGKITKTGDVNTCTIPDGNYVSIRDQDMATAQTVILKRDLDFETQLMFVISESCKETKTESDFARECIAIRGDVANGVCTVEAHTVGVATFHTNYSKTSPNACVVGLTISAAPAVASAK